MVGRIIPLAITAEDDDTVTYTWGRGDGQGSAVINKQTGTATPIGHTPPNDAYFVQEYLKKVRAINNMTGYPAEAPIYK